MSIYQITETKTVTVRTLVKADSIEEAELKYLAGDSGDCTEVEIDLVQGGDLETVPFDH